MQKGGFFLIFFSILRGNCASYKQNIMFKPDGNPSQGTLSAETLQAERNYVIQKNDYLGLEIHSNNGERLIDPNPELSQSQQVSQDSRSVAQYLVDTNGVAKFPLVGELKVEGLTLRQAEEVLQKEYGKFFISPFVGLKFNNKRVVVLGAPGGQVIPLTNENVTLAEILALAKGLNNDSKAQNIRLLRKDMVYSIDFSTVEGYRKGNMIMEPGDIIYVEPVRKPFVEGFRDYSILLTFIVSLTTIITLITR